VDASAFDLRDFGHFSASARGANYRECLGSVEVPANAELIALCSPAFRKFGTTPAHTNHAKEKWPAMIKPYRILQSISLLSRLRSGPNLTSARFEVRRPVSTHCLANPFLLVSLLLCLAPGFVTGQTAAEAAGATSVSATAPSNSKAPAFPSDPTPGDKDKSPHLLAPVVQQSEVANRKALEQKAGKRPGKLLLRSIPTGAQVWVNGMFVGHAPLLMILAPGKYQVELRGQRMEHAARAVDLLPDETRTVSLALSIRYPTRASVH